MKAGRGKVQDYNEQEEKFELYFSYDKSTVKFSKGELLSLAALDIHQYDAGTSTQSISLFSIYSYSDICVCAQHMRLTTGRKRLRQRQLTVSHFDFSAACHSSRMCAC